MHIFRIFRFLTATVLIFAAFLLPINFQFEVPTDSVFTARAQTQQLVEEVDVQGNRRFRDEDLLYYIQTRPGDAFSAPQLERDLQALLGLGNFDKTESRVLTQPGLRGGVIVIFQVKELPIIRDLQFEGTKAITESDILKAFRENRVGISKESVYDPVKTQRATRILRELLSAKGFPNAQISFVDEEVSATSVALIFTIDQGERSRLVQIEFEGNTAFKDGDLKSQLKITKETGLFNFSRFTGTDILDRNKLEYDIRKNLLPYMRSKGFLQARHGEPVIEGLGRKRTGFFLPLPFLSSKDDALKVTIPINEGKVYRVGEVKVAGNSIFSEQQIQAIIGLQKGEVANGKLLTESLNEGGLKKLYGSQGFIQYSAETEPTFKDNPTNAAEGIADFNINIEEGKQFTLRRLEFSGNTFTRDNVLRREFILNEGDIYNDIAFETSVLRLNQTGYFDPLDKDKDKELRTDEAEGFVDALVRVKERGRQQISFNGGIAGQTGSFFGLEYSTNNLLGRGEVLSFNVGAGNRQRNFVFSFTEPYFRDRPISLGFSLFASSRKFFGEGTFLSDNQQAIFDAQTQTGVLTTDSGNLFTQTTYGASLSATAPLSEFYRKRRFTQLSRVGLVYQLTSTRVQDPEVNQDGGANAIPVLFRQPNITTSRITPTFIYNSYQYSGQGIDPVRGTNIAAQFGLAGLGGDVRTYSPSLQYIQYIPLRRKKSSNPEVFGFRILAATTGSFATTSKIRNANSLAFVNGVPLYERFYLGDEQTIRGYDTRSIGPIAPFETFITSRNLSVARNQTGTPIASTGIDPRDLNGSIGCGNDPNERCKGLLEQATFTGIGGANPFRTNRNVYPIGGDTQLLGNFEYRVSIFGPLTIAAFADVGAAFNLRKSDALIINSEFQPDQPFLGFNDLSNIFLQSTAGSNFQPSLIGGLIFKNGRPLTRSDFQNFITNGGRSDPNTGLPLDSANTYQIGYVRGEAQTNQRFDISNSSQNSLKDAFRSSLGLEFRIQIPVVNAPFRLIYAFNPNARQFITVGEQQIFLGEKKSDFRFSVGRTF